jgi:replicative DNA helicase
MLENVKLYIDETPNININDLLIKARKLKRENDDLCAIFIDYIGLIKTSKKVESRQLELSEISSQLKALARDLKITVIAFSQLSREVEKRNDKRPMMSDLRESGSLEQDADQVFLMYREDLYVKQNSIKPANAVYQPYYETLEASGNENSISPVDIMLVKNRSGETGNITLLFFKALSSFENPDTDVLVSLRNMQRAHASRSKKGSE